MSDPTTNLPACDCPDPALCQRLKRHIHGNQWRIWNSSAPKAVAYKRQWLKQAGLEKDAGLLAIKAEAAGASRLTTADRERIRRIPLVISQPCRHLGERRPGPCGSDLHPCGRHGGLCTRTRPCTEAARVCLDCPDYTPRGSAEDDTTWQWISTAKLTRDAIAFAGRLPADIGGIVGVPRSGMLPAAVIATHLHLPLYTLEAGRLVRARVGDSRGNAVGGRGQRLVFVDDTVYQGYSFAKLQQFRRGNLFTAVYCRRSMEHVVDLYHEAVPNLHVLEWNWANNGPMAGLCAPSCRGYAGGIAVDMDGILCHDADSGGQPGTPYMLARNHPIKLIVTGRHARHRAGTEAWLRQWGIQWDRLEMLPDDQQQDMGHCAAHKAHYYERSNCGLYIESDPDQAAAIWRRTGRPVICPRIEHVFQGPDGAR